MEISSVSRVGIAQAGALVLRRRVSPSPFVPQITAAREAVFRPEGAAPARFVQVRAALNRADTREALNEAVSAGIGITSALRDLRDGIRLAASSLTNPSANLLNREQTRVSVVNIQAQVEVLSNAIDRLVRGAAVSGVNLISSSNGPVRLQTTAFGGGLEVTAQPLDSIGLGLNEINLLANGGINGALATITEAISLADRRLENLEILQRVAGGSIDFNSQFLARAISDFGSQIPARGTLINLIG